MLRSVYSSVRSSLCTCSFARKQSQNMVPSAIAQTISAELEKDRPIASLGRR